jgi:hypothetical protein
MNEPSVSIIFVREYKNFIGAFNKKAKEDYVLNVNKIIKEKFKTKFIVPNRVQSFLVNYEIRKLLDKAIHIKNRKYRRVIYLNSNLTASVILNTIDFIEEEYTDLVFTYHLVESKSVDEEEIMEIDKLERIKIK